MDVCVGLERERRSGVKKKRIDNLTSQSGESIGARLLDTFKEHPHITNWFYL